MNTVQQTFEQMNVPTCVIDSEQHIVFWNELAATAFGHSVEDALGQTCWQLFKGRTPQGEAICRPNCPLMNQINSTQPVGEFDMVTMDIDGTTQQLRVSSQPVLTEDRQSVQLVHFLRPYPIHQPTYNLYLLGPVRLQTASGTTVEGPDWSDPYLQATFVYLALNRDHVVTKTELRLHIWPHLPQAEADRQITAVIEKLCRSLTVDPNTPIIQEQNGYKLSEAVSLSLDIDTFDKLLAEAADTQQTQHKIPLLQQAVKLYRGDFLINLPFDQKWISAWRQHFRQGYFAALQKLSALYEQAGDLESAQKTYLNALTAEPFSLENNRHFHHLFGTRDTGSVQTLRQCKRLISLLQNELEFLLEEKHNQPHDDADSAQNPPQEEERGLR